MRLVLTEREKFTVLRRRKRIRLNQIAMHVGCDLSIFSRWENGTSNPPTMDLIEQYQQYILDYKD